MLVCNILTDWVQSEITTFTIILNIITCQSQNQLLILSKVDGPYWTTSLVLPAAGALPGDSDSLMLSNMDTLWLLLEFFLLCGLMLPA